MRESKEWQDYLDKVKRIKKVKQRKLKIFDRYIALLQESVFNLMYKYGFHTTVGDQDWFTNVSFNVSKQFSL